MDEKLCEERHRALTLRLERQEKWTSEHEHKIDCLVKSEAQNAVTVRNLCDKIDNLINTIKWFMGIIGGSVIGLFIWLLQQQLSK